MTGQSSRSRLSPGIGWRLPPGRVLAQLGFHWDGQWGALAGRSSALHAGQGLSGKAFEVSFQNDSCFLRITSSEFLEPSSWVISDHLFCEGEYLKSARLYLGQPIFTSRQAFVFRKVTSPLKAHGVSCAWEFWSICFFFASPTRDAILRGY